MSYLTKFLFFVGCMHQHRHHPSYTQMRKKCTELAIENITYCAQVSAPSLKRTIEAKSVVLLY